MLVEIQESETWAEVSGHGRQERERGREGGTEEERLTGELLFSKIFHNQS